MVSGNGWRGPCLRFSWGLRASEGLARQRILRPSHEPDGVNFLVDRAEESQYRSVGINGAVPPLHSEVAITDVKLIRRS
jgi:hypothetical protein